MQAKYSTENFDKVVEILVIQNLNNHLRAFSSLWSTPLFSQLRDPLEVFLPNVPPCSFRPWLRASLRDSHSLGDRPTLAPFRIDLALAPPVLAGKIYPDDRLL
jgi:hypothetical protein